MAIIYKKTLKGVEEIALRNRGLQLRLRTYLILVDGVKSDDEIQKLNTGLPEVCMVLAALKDEGYIDIVGTVKSDTQAPIAPAIKSTAPQNTPQPSAAPVTNNLAYSSAPSASFLDARDSMVRDITQLLGKDAEIVVTKIQRCETAMDLFAMMMGLKKIIGMYANSEKAEQFANKFAYISTL